AIAIVPILAFYWAEYYKQKEIDYEIDWRIKEISFKDTSSFIDIYAIRKIIEKEYSSDIVKQINNYLRAIFIGIIDFYDPSNIACVAITNDISVSIAGQINEWYRIVNDPNIRIEDKAAVLGRIAGLVFSISFVGSIHSSKSFRDFIDDKFGSKFGIINLKLNEIWKLSSKVGEKAIGFLTKAAEKIRFEIGDVTDEFIDLIRIVLKHGEKESRVNEAIDYAIERLDGGSIDLSELSREVAIKKFKIIKAKIYGKEYKEIDIHKSAFEALGVKIPSSNDETLFIVLEVLKDNGEKIDFVRKIHTPNDKGFINFKISAPYDEVIQDDKIISRSLYEVIGQDNFWIKVKGTIKNSRDFIDLLGKKFVRKKVGLSTWETIFDKNNNEVILRISEGGVMKTIELEGVDLHYILFEGYLGLRGKIKKIYNFEKDQEIAICTNGKEILIEIFDNRGYGNKVTNIIVNEDVVTFKTDSNVIYKRFYIEKPRVVLKDEVNGIIEMNKGSVEGYHYEILIDNKKAGGGIAEYWTGLSVEDLIPESKTIWISGGSGFKDKADVEINEKGIKVPIEVEARSGMDIEELLNLFEWERYKKEGAVADMIKNFKEKGYENAYGYIVYYGINEVKGSSPKWIKNNSIWIKYYRNGDYEIKFKFSSSD
ncbi:MAG: hypothetical protein QXY18_06955, partial [Nitrososphaerota archaeon]